MIFYMLWTVILEFKLEYSEHIGVLDISNRLGQQI